MDPRFGQQMSAPPMGAMPPNMYGAPPYGAPPMMYPPPPMGMMPPNGSMMMPPMGGAPKAPPPRPVNPALEDKLTTVWVGRITPGVGDDAIKKLLEKCGEVVSWKRLPDAATGQLKTFGFADFKNAQGALRAVKLLSDLFLGDKNLQLKVDEKTQKYLDSYTTVKKEIMDKNKNPSATPVAAEGGFTAAELEFDPELLDLKKQITDIVTEYHRAYGIDERKVKQRVQEEQTRNDRGDRERNKAREEEENRRREEREREREERRKERAEREFRNKEREWEGHEKDREKEKERRLMMERERIKMRQRNIEIDEQDDRQHRRKIRSREKRRERQRELEEDERERVAEIEEIEQRRIEEERRQDEERRRREEELRQEELEAQRREERSAASPAITSPSNDGSAAPLKLGLKLNASTGGAVAPNKKVAISGWQEAEEPEQYDAIKKKKPGVALDFAGVDKKAKSEELKSVIERIPTDKEQLFNYTIDWNVVDQIVDERKADADQKVLLEVKAENAKHILSHMTSKSQNLVDLISRSALPAKDYTSILRAIGTAKVVLIGEASHGTHEFYKERCEITKRLIIEKGVTFIAAEADWPDAFEINKFVRGKGAPTLDQAFSRFERFPRWLWRNKVMVDFIKWLKEWNDKQTDQTMKVGFYGLDLYSFYESAQAVLRYLKDKDAAAYSRARDRYAFFDRYKSDAQAYGYATNFGFDKDREVEVTRELSEMNKKSATQQESLREGEDLFAAEINAKVVKNAEEYYRCMFSGNTWNMRDSHMVETLKEIMDFIETSKQEVGGSVAKAVVWAHNSHLGDASATDASKNQEINIGQLVREKWGKENTFNIGFTTYSGTVSAADEWDGDVRTMQINKGMPGSYEELFHSVGKDEFMLLFRCNPTGNIKVDKELVNELSKSRLERAIGVIYKADTERYSHYFNCKISQQFDCVIHIDETSALEPLDIHSAVNSNEPETYPMGL